MSYNYALGAIRLEQYEQASLDFWPEDQFPSYLYIGFQNIYKYYIEKELTLQRDKIRYLTTQMQTLFPFSDFNSCLTIC